MAPWAVRVSWSFMQAQQFSLPIEQSGATDLPAGLTPEQFGALVGHPDGLLKVMPWLCRQAIGSLPAAQGAGVIVQFRGGASHWHGPRPGFGRSTSSNANTGTAPVCGPCTPSRW